MEPFTDRPDHLHRLTSVYSTTWTEDGREFLTPAHVKARARNRLSLGRIIGGTGEPVAAMFGFGGYRRHFERASAELPRIVGSTPAEHVRIGDRTIANQGARLWAFWLPVEAVVYALTLDVAADLADPGDLAGLLDLLRGLVVRREEILVDDRPLMAACVAGTTLEPFLDGRSSGFELTTGALVHQQLLLAREGTDLLDWPAERLGRTVQQILSRSILETRADGANIRQPPELNKRVGSIGCVKPGTSVLGGQDSEVEAGTLVSIVMALGCNQLLSGLRADSRRALAALQSLSAEGGDHRRRRIQLAALSEVLALLELDLSFGVEGYLDIRVLVPEYPIQQFHDALVDLLALAPAAVALDGMLARLGTAISAERSSIETAQRQMDERYRRRWAVAWGLISAVAVPLTLIFGFFGANASQVRSNRSFFDGRYMPWLLGLLALITVGLVVYFGIWIIDVVSEVRLDRRLRSTEPPHR